jgi:hypothetical protein
MVESAFKLVKDILSGKAESELWMDKPHRYVWHENKHLPITDEMYFVIEIVPECTECGRVFDLILETDAEEWIYGHDCE